MKEAMIHHCWHLTTPERAHGNESLQSPLLCHTEQASALKYGLK